MYFDFAEFSPNQAYFTMTQTLVPRPIAWVLTENAAGDYNLAPFSYFNAVCSDPPLVMLSIGRKPDGSPKDTRVNIEQRGHFVAHIAHREQAKPMTESSATLDYGDSELARLGLDTVPFQGFGLPRLADCRVAFACERYEIREIGNARQTLLLGLVKSVYVDDAAVTTDAKGRTKIDAARIDPLGRLGGGEYSTMEGVVTVPRPA
ncbi:MAG: flavin reductase family protein [Gammaproteobacteria bacterium]|jgi:flavin reductase (DIM6/NTAB) family NADH-FMN oxidoreductase RutF|nr:flavin reductase family protein [Gammaproteobacteria bacterium]